jgi:hypothetical protein
LTIPRQSAAVVPAEVDAMMIEYDRRVEHFEVVGIYNALQHRRRR